MKKTSSNILISLVLFIAAFVSVRFMPDSEEYRFNFLTLVVMILSGICFTEGHNRLGKCFNRPMGKSFGLVRKILHCLAGLLILAFAFYVLINEKFSPKAVTIFVLFLAYALYMIYEAFSKFRNKAIDGTKHSSMIYIPLEELYEAFKDVDTPLGRPWIGKFINKDDPELIFGPTDDGSFLSCYYTFGIFAVSDSRARRDGFWIPRLDPDDALAHKLKASWDINTGGTGLMYNLLSRSLPGYYLEMFEEYVKSGRASCSFTDIFLDKEAKLFAFNEKFAITRHKYNLLDSEGNVRYHLNRKFPFLKYNLTNTLDESEAVRIRRLIRHPILPQYDIYINGLKYGRMKKHFNIFRSRFSMHTGDGDILVNEVTATIGGHFIIYKNGDVIGTISEKINPKVSELLFDNFVIMVFDERNLPLVASLCVMLRSFKNIYQS